MKYGKKKFKKTENGCYFNKNVYKNNGTSKLYNGILRTIYLKF